jgi:hypothetical protein
VQVGVTVAATSTGVAGMPVRSSTSSMGVVMASPSFCAMRCGRVTTPSDRPSLLPPAAGFAGRPSSLVVTACSDDDAEERTASSADTSAEETEDSTAGEEPETAADVEGEGASIRVLDVVATGEEGEDGTMTHRFEPLEDVTAEPAQLSLVNDGMEPHQVQLRKLNEGVTMDDVGAALATGNPGALLEIGSFAAAPVWSISAPNPPLMPWSTSRRAPT